MDLRKLNGGGTWKELEKGKEKREMMQFYLNLINKYIGIKKDKIQEINMTMFKTEAHN